MDAKSEIKRLREMSGKIDPDDLWDVMDSLADENERLNRLTQEILEKSIKEKDPPFSADQRDKDRRITAMLKAALRKNRDELQEYGFRPVSDTLFAEGKEVELDNLSFGLGVRGMRGSEKSALGTALMGDAVTGSYLIPEMWFDEILRVAVQSSQMMSKVLRIDMRQRTINMAGIASTPSFTEVADESTAKTESAPTFDTGALSCKTFAAWLAVTEEMLEDSIGNLGQLFTDLYGEAWGQMFDYQVLKANSGGSDTFDGMLYNSSVNDVTMDAGDTSYQNADFDDLVEMENAISDAVGENGLNGAYWIMARRVFNHLKTLKDDNGNYIYQKPEGTVPGNIWGHPYIISDQMPKPETGSLPFLILGNPKYWLYGDRVGLQIRVFDQTAQTMQYDEIFFRARVRAAFKAGRPAAFARLNTAGS